MRDYCRSVLARVLKEQSGQILPWMALVFVLFLGMGGLTLDLGQAYVAYNELQASTDAAALAGGYALALSTATKANVQTAAAHYSSAATSSYSTSAGLNVNPNLSGATIQAINFSCNSTYSTEVPCSGSPTGYNEVQVVQTTTIPTQFIRVLAMLGVKSATSLTLKTTASALMRGAVNAQYNIAVVVDSTGSMSTNDPDNNCTKTTKEVCAMEGVQSLLSGLTPCSVGSTSSNCKSAFDSVALFVFPNVTSSSTSDAVACPSSTPNHVAYSTPTPGFTWPTTFTGSTPDYELTSGVTGATNGFTYDYSSTNAANGAINPNSPLGIVTGASTTKKCGGLTTPISGEGTYLAGAIYSAQSALIAAQTNNPGSQNAMVILTDGDASASNAFTTQSGGSETAILNANKKTGLYPSMIDQCQQAITAAQYSTTNNTTVYIVAYDAQKSGCSTDAKAYQDPCTNLQAMATAPADFYSDAKGTGSCPSSANPNLTLDQIFQSVASSFTLARLIPN